MVFTKASEQKDGFAVTTKSSYLTTWSQLSDLEKILIGSNVIAVSLLILQSICFIVFAIKVRTRKRRLKTEIISKEELGQGNETVRYSRQPLKQRSNPEIYESLKDLIDEPPPPPSIDTLPRNKITPFKKQLSSPDGACNDRIITSPCERPRYPLPHETESKVDAPPLLPKCNDFATLPTRKPQFKRLQPAMMQTLPIRRSPRPVQHRGLNIATSTQKPILLPRPQLSPGYRSPTDINSIPTSQFHFTRSPETNFLPTLYKENQMHQAHTRSQQQIQKSHFDNELMMKLKKRAAMIPDSSNSTNELINDRTIPTPRSNFKYETQKFFKPLPHTPRGSEESYGWVDNFNEIVPLEPINLYNM